MGQDLRNAFFRVYDREESFLTNYVGTYVYYRLRQLVTKISEDTVVNDTQDPRDVLSTEDLTKHIFLALEFNVYQNFGFVGEAAPTPDEKPSLRPDERRQ
jgi:hypothetical protein